MNCSLNKAYHNLGKTIFESGIAKAFGIEPDQQIDFNNEKVLTFIEFILHHANDNIASYENTTAAPSRKLNPH